VRQYAGKGSEILARLVEHETQASRSTIEVKEELKRIMDGQYIIILHPLSLAKLVATKHYSNEPSTEISVSKR